MSENIPTARELLADLRNAPLDDIPEDVGAADILAEDTGRSVEEFQPNGEFPQVHPGELGGESDE